MSSAPTLEEITSALEALEAEAAAAISEAPDAAALEQLRIDRLQSPHVPTSRSKGAGGDYKGS